jgi:iron complex transport system permease protein
LTERIQSSFFEDGSAASLHSHPSDHSLRRRALIVVAALVALSAAGILFACMTGSVALPLADVAAAAGELMRGSGTNPASSMAASLLDLRWSRALTAYSTGASLALAGVMMQALLRNPLADPYVLGISGGTAVGALAAMLFATAAWTVDAAALCGALTVSLLLYALARRDLRSGLAAEGGSSLLLLTGVILSSGCMALVALMLSIAPEGRLRGMVFWLIGDLSGTEARMLPWLVLIAAFVFAVRAARAVNLMAMHGEAAAALGIRVAALRQGLFLCAGALTASAVTGAGSIGFVGLIVPHACRFAFGPDHRLLMPASALAGGTFLVVADTLARTVVAPQQLPVGVLTALIGVPAFLLQLHHIRRK